MKIRKKIIASFVVLACLTSVALQAQPRHLSREEFRAKQQAYIQQSADLTEEEASRFFPVYFELQDKKQKINAEVWKLMRKGREDGVTEEQYSELIENICDLRASSVSVEKKYLDKFKDLLPASKIFRVQQAETSFHRELLKDMRRKRM